ARSSRSRGSRGAERRERLAVLVSIVGAGFALVLALAFASWAVVHTLAGTLDLLGAAGLAALLWASVAAWLLHVRGGLAFLRHLNAADADAAAFASAQLRLRAAEEEVTTTARRLATVMAVETAEGIAAHVATVAERDAQAAVHELV